MGVAQVNVRELHTCNDPDQYATVRATAEFKVGMRVKGANPIALVRAQPVHRSNLCRSCRDLCPGMEIAPAREPSSVYERS